jgi:hypothetical protein
MGAGLSVIGPIVKTHKGRAGGAVAVLFAGGWFPQFTGCVRVEVSAPSEVHEVTKMVAGVVTDTAELAGHPCTVVCLQRRGARAFGRMCETVIAGALTLAHNTQAPWVSAVPPAWVSRPDGPTLAAEAVLLLEALESPYDDFRESRLRELTMLLHASPDRCRALVRDTRGFLDALGAVCVQTTHSVWCRIEAAGLLWVLCTTTHTGASHVDSLRALTSEPSGLGACEQIAHLCLAGLVAQIVSASY